MKKTILRDLSKTFPTFRDPAKIFRDPRFSRYHSPPLDCFEHPKNSLLKSSHPKKYLPKFFFPTKILKSEISNPKKILRSSLSLGIRGIWTKRTSHSLFRCQVHVPQKTDNPVPSLTKVVDVFCLCLLKPLHFTTDLPRTRVTPLCYWDSNLVIVLDLGLSFLYCQ